VRQLRVWVDDGFRVCLLVSEGVRKAHLLYVPTLEHVEMPLSELARQLRVGVAGDVPIARGLVGRIEEKRRHWRALNYRFSEVFVREALDAIRSERREAA
jgi:hypothetical protein